MKTTVIFKEFSSTHFEKYLDKFNSDSYMAMIGCIAERLNKQEITTCMTAFKILFEQDLVKVYDNLDGHPGGHWESNLINNDIKTINQSI